jgi:hypothetical protein
MNSRLMNPLNITILMKHVRAGGWEITENWSINMDSFNGCELPESILCYRSTDTRSGFRYVNTG